MKKTINQLDCIVENPQNKRAVVLIHGFGADFRDLAPLHEYLDPEGHWTWIFPNGPLTVPLGMAMEGRAWFHIPMDELQREIATGVPRDYSNLSPQGFSQALSQLGGMIFELTQSYDEIVVGGFSQGAMMASHVLADCGAHLRGALLYSSVLLDQQRLQVSLEKVGPVPFLQSHGSQDPVLSINNGKKLFSLLQKRGWAGEWLEFRGGHEIPMMVLQRSAQLLAKLTD